MDYSRKKKDRGDEPNWAIYTCMWKYHEETSCVTILNMQKHHFFFLVAKSEKRKVKQVLPRVRGWGR
jgi:hypothetical protein